MVLVMPGHHQICIHDGGVIAINTDDLFAPLLALYVHPGGMAVESFRVEKDTLIVTLTGGECAAVQLPQQDTKSNV